MYGIRIIELEAKKIIEEQGLISYPDLLSSKSEEILVVAHELFHARVIHHKLNIPQS